MRWKCKSCGELQENNLFGFLRKYIFKVKPTRKQTELKILSETLTKIQNEKPIAIDTPVKTWTHYISSFIASIGRTFKGQGSGPSGK